MTDDTPTPPDKVWLVIDERNEPAAVFPDPADAARLMLEHDHPAIEVVEIGSWRSPARMRSSGRRFKYTPYRLKRAAQAFADGGIDAVCAVDGVSTRQAWRVVSEARDAGML